MVCIVDVKIRRLLALVALEMLHMRGIVQTMYNFSATNPTSFIMSQLIINNNNKVDLYTAPKSRSH